MGRCIVDALLTVDPRLGLAAWWRRRPADDGAGRRRLVFLCGGEYREVEGRYMGAVTSPARGHGWSGPFIILHWLLGYVTHLGWTMASHGLEKINTFCAIKIVFGP